MTAIRVLLAPDKFKGCMTAADAAAQLRCGLLAERPDLLIDVLPIADGGDGTVAAVTAAGFASIPVETVGPTGEPVETSFGMSLSVAVVELASACGMSKLPGGVPAPMTASSFGLGLIIKAAVAQGARTVVIGLGGSASTDGGAGMLTALGARVLDRGGKPIRQGAIGLQDVDLLDLTGLDRWLPLVHFVLASDVDSPLLGETGAAAVFGPQKGMTVAQVVEAETNLCRWAEVVRRCIPGADPMAAGGGAAGGTGFAAQSVLASATRSGAAVVLDLIDFNRHLAVCDLVVTGEGSLDAQTLRGKGPAAVAAAGQAGGKPVFAVAGSIALTQRQLAAAGFAGGIALMDYQTDRAHCIADAGPLLQRAGRQLARHHLDG